MVWFFAFGISTNPDTVSQDIGHYKTYKKAVLKDHIYTFTGYHEKFKGGTSTILPMEGGQVLGVAFNIEKEQLDDIVKTGHGYVLKTSRAIIDNEEVNVYTLQPERIKEVNSPSLYYIESVREGLYFHYPKEMVDLYLKRALKRTKSIDFPVQRDISKSYKDEYGALLRRTYPWKITNKSPFGSGMIIVNPNERTVPHNHDEEETFIILEGKGKVSIDSDTEEVKKGDIVYFEPYSVHSIKNTGTEPLKFMALWWGAVGVEQYVLEQYS
jgi:mannose-6-phosphate isomerase-like protein (cupin superfamily)